MRPRLSLLLPRFRLSLRRRGGQGISADGVVKGLQRARRPATILSLHPNTILAVPYPNFMPYVIPLKAVARLWIANNAHDGEFVEGPTGECDGNVSITSISGRKFDAVDFPATPDWS